MIVVMASLGMLALVAFVITFVVLYQKRLLLHKNDMAKQEAVYQKKLLAATIEVAEMERHKIATNLHDEINMSFNVIRMNTTKIQRHISDPLITAENLNKNIKIIDDTQKNIRSIVHELMPAILVKVGIKGGLEELTRKLNETQAISVNFEPADIPVEIDKKKELHIYRMVKELINNAIKHDKPTCLKIKCRINDNYLIFEISHNGKGISDDEIKELINSNRGIGLRSIISRAQLTNSQISYHKNDSNEAKIIILTPLP